MVPFDSSDALRFGLAQTQRPGRKRICREWQETMGKHDSRGKKYIHASCRSQALGAEKEKATKESCRCVARSHKVAEDDARRASNARGTYAGGAQKAETKISLKAFDRCWHCDSVLHSF